MDDCAHIFLWSLRPDANVTGTWYESKARSCKQLGKNLLPSRHSRAGPPLLTMAVQKPTFEVFAPSILEVPALEADPRVSSLCLSIL